MLIIFSVSCATETVTQEVDPEPRETSFTLTSPENGQLFSPFSNRVPFAFSYTRESTDFSAYNFTLNLCRNMALDEGCIDPVSVTMSEEDESALFLRPTARPEQSQPTFTEGVAQRYGAPIFPLGLLILFVLVVWFFLRQEKRSQLASASMLTLFALLVGGVLGGALSCTTTLTEEVIKDASPDLTGRAAITIEISADALGLYYWQVTATRTDGTAEPQTSPAGTFSIGVMSSQLTAFTFEVGDNVGEPIRVEGATSYSLSGCDDFTIDTTTGQVTVASVPTSGASQECTLTLGDGTGMLAIPLTIHTFLFDQASYDFVITFALAEAGGRVGVVPVTVSGIEAISYAFAPACAGFAIDSTTGQITAAAASPATGDRNCTVQATAEGETTTTAVTISECDFSEPATSNSEISDCDFDGASNTADLDPEGDNLIDVSNIEQLNAIRFDLNGDGTPTGTAADMTTYRTAYGITTDGTQGCGSCTGFELTRSLDFTDADSYQADTVNTAYTTGTGWLPIGDDTNGFSAAFDGGHFSISDLFIDRPEGTANDQYVGLFGGVASTGVVRFLGVSAVDVEGEEFIGGLAGINRGTINNCYVTGSLTSEGESTGTDATILGGLVGILNSGGSINNSYANATLVGEAVVGGLVGENRGSINNSWSSGSVDGNNGIGGLVGRNDNIGNSYSLVQVASTTDTSVGGLVGQILIRGVLNDSYAVGSVTGTDTGFADATGGLVSLLSGTITGVNYFADTAGTNGIGFGTCTTAVCIQATGATFTDRQTWLRDTLDEAANDGLNWDTQMDSDGNAVWGDLGRSGVFPCLMNMPEGALPCPAPMGTTHDLPGAAPGP